MNVLFVLHSANVLLYIHSILDPLIRGGNKVQVIFLGEKKGVGQVIYDVSRRLPSLEVAPCAKETISKTLLLTRNILNLASYLSQGQAQAEYFEPRHAATLPPWIRYLASFSLVRRCLTQPKTRDFLRWIESAIPPDERLVNEVRSASPNVMVLCGWWSADGETGYMKAAHHLGIPTVVYAFTWDNLSSKGMIQIKPNHLICWNRFHAEQARILHEIPPDQVLISGATFFDKWLNPPPPLSRADFCRSVNFSPEQPFIIYLVSVASDTGDESQLISDLARFLRQTEIPELRGIQILVRPHPVNRQALTILEPNVQVWSGKNTLPETRAWVQDFHSGLKHCVATIGINNSAMIDSIINDRPSPTLLASQFDKFQQVTHFKNLLATKALDTCEGFQKVVDVLMRNLTHADTTREYRKRFVEQFIRPRGRHTQAGAIASKFIDAVGRGIDLGVVEREIDSSIVSG